LNNCSSYSVLGVNVAGLRTKLVVALIVFFAGMATGIFVTMPCRVEARSFGRAQSGTTVKTSRDRAQGTVLVSRTARVEVGKAIANNVAQQDSPANQ
jgi:hypothetical protein